MIAIVIAIGWANGADAGLTDGLIAYWQFENNGNDSSGNGRSVSLFGTAGYGTGLFGQGLALPGNTSSYAQQLANDTAFDFGSSDFTIQVWVNFSNHSKEETLIEKFTGGGGPGWTFTTPGDDLQFYANPAAVMNAGETMSTGVWHEAVLRRSGNMFSMFFDGSQVATQTSATAMPVSANPLLIGKRDAQDGRDFSVAGTMDEIAVWGRALSDAEVAAVWNGGNGKQLPIPVPPGSPTIILSPASSVNPFNSDHTITATLTDFGICAETGGAQSNDGDGEGTACTSDSDCGDVDDDFCDYSEVKVGFQVTGTNSKDTGVKYSPDSNHQVVFQYHDDKGTGADVITACVDTLSADPGETTAECLGEVGGDPSDYASDPAYKTWVPTVTLSPPGAFNPIGASHTVVANINGVPRKCTGGTNGGQKCASLSDCPDSSVGTVCDLSGYQIGLRVSGSNNTEQPFAATNAQGQVPFTYSSSIGGTDTLQACGDLGEPAGTLDENTVAACLLDGSSEPSEDIASNLSIKHWGSQYATLSPSAALNLVGTSHTVTTTLSGFPSICSGGANHYNACTSTLNCTDGDSCGLGGYPVLFAVIGTCSGGNNGGAICVSNLDCNSKLCVGGPNLGEKGSAITSSGGVASKTYNSNGVVGEDTIQACVDADPSGTNSLPDDSDFIECLNDSGFENDVPTNTVIKDWLANFVTGGAGTNPVGAVISKKKSVQFAGVVTPNFAGPGIRGSWNESVYDSGKTLSCHWKSFVSLGFSGPATINPPSAHNTATFTTAPVVCSDGNSYSATVTIVDGGEGKKAANPDYVNVTSTPASSLSTGGTVKVTTGNFQVHSIF